MVAAALQAGDCEYPDLGASDPDRHCAFTGRILGAGQPEALVEVRIRADVVVFEDFQRGAAEAVHHPGLLLHPGVVVGAGSGRAAWKTRC